MYLTPEQWSIKDDEKSAMIGNSPCSSLEDVSKNKARHYPERTSPVCGETGLPTTPRLYSTYVYKEDRCRHTLYVPEKRSLKYSRHSTGHFHNESATSGKTPPTPSSPDQS